MSACGIGKEAFWDGLLAEPPEGLRRVHDFDPTPYYANPKEVRRADRFEQFATAAAAEAIEQSGLPTGDPVRLGVIVGTGIGGLQTIEDQTIVRYEKGPRRVSPFLIPMVMGNAPAAAVSMRYGFQGPCENVVTACAAGTHSIANAARLISSGRCTAVIAGSTEAAMTETGVAGFTNMTAMSSTLTSRPFDEDRDGFVMAEGAGVLVLEDWEPPRPAAPRSSPRCSAGPPPPTPTTSPRRRPTAPARSPASSSRSTRPASSPGDIVHVNAHGTSTPLNDAAEAKAISKVFGSPGPAVTSIKGVIGHALGAAGSIEAVAVVLSMQKALIPPTAGYTTPDPEMAPIDIVTGAARPWTPGPTISNSFGFGGHNGTVIFAPLS